MDEIVLTCREETEDGGCGEAEGGEDDLAVKLKESVGGQITDRGKKEEEQSAEYESKQSAEEQKKDSGPR